MKKPKPNEITCQFSFVCPYDWYELEAGDKPDVRFCDHCKQDVFHTSKFIIARNLAAEGKCVAYEPEMGDRTMGLMVPFD